MKSGMYCLVILFFFFSACKNSCHLLWSPSKNHRPHLCPVPSTLNVIIICRTDQMDTFLTVCMEVVVRRKREGGESFRGFDWRHTGVWLNWCFNRAVWDRIFMKESGIPSQRDTYFYLCNNRKRGWVVVTVLTSCIFIFQGPKIELGCLKPNIIIIL